MDNKWYLLYVREKKELRVATLLNAKGIDSFCPFQESEANGIFRNKINREPLLPGYVFVKGDRMNLRKIRETQYVINWVHWKNKPVEIKEENVAALKSFFKTYRNISVLSIPVNPEAELEIKKSFSEKMTEIVLPEIGYSFRSKDPDSHINQSIKVRTIQRKEIMEKSEEISE